jgi:hypothetical protein
MKKKFFVLIVTAFFLFSVFAGLAVAASSIVRDGNVTMSPPPGGKGWGKSLMLVLLCTAHTDGTFTSTVIDNTDMLPARDRYEYWQAGYYLLNAWTVNDASTYPSSGAVTITDSSGQQIIGTSATDTLTLSTSASGVGYFSVTRGAGQRAITNQLTISVSDTGSAANIFYLYLVFGY